MSGDDKLAQDKTDPRSAVFAREPGHSHAVDAPCYPEACTGHPDWQRIAAEKVRDPADVIAGHMPQRLTPEPFDQGPKTDLASVEARVSALERHLFDPCETSDPSEAPEEPLELVKGSIAGPGYIYGDRADRANALLGTVETILATGGAVETHGVRIEPCDEYGRTETTRRADSLAARADFFRLQLDRARRERDVALAGAESAEKDLGKLDRAVHDLGMALVHTREYVMPVNLPAVPGWSWYDALRAHAPGLLPADARVDTMAEAEQGDETGENRQAPLEPTDEQIGRGLIVCGAQRLADVGGGRHVLVECELFEHADDEPHHAAPRGPVTW